MCSTHPLPPVGDRSPLSPLHQVRVWLTLWLSPSLFNSRCVCLVVHLSVKLRAAKGVTLSVDISIPPMCVLGWTYPTEQCYIVSPVYVSVVQAAVARLCHRRRVSIVILTCIELPCCKYVSSCVVAFISVFHWFSSSSMSWVLRTDFLHDNSKLTVTSVRFSPQLIVSYLLSRSRCPGVDNSCKHTYKGQRASSSGGGCQLWFLNHGASPPTAPLSPGATLKDTV